MVINKRDSSHPEAVVDERGNANLLWCRGDGLVSARRLSGSGWTVPKSLASDAYSYDLGVSRSGTLTAVWATSDGAIVSARRPLAQPWRHSHVIVKAGTHSPTWLALTVSRTGRAALVWVEKKQTWAVFSPEPGHWEDATLVDDVGHSWWVDLAIAANGDTGFLWADHHRAKLRWRTAH